MLRTLERPDFCLVAPLTQKEKAGELRRLRGSRPGPSGLKLEFIGLFPDLARSGRPWTLLVRGTNCLRRTTRSFSTLSSWTALSQPNWRVGWRYQGRSVERRLLREPLTLANRVRYRPRSSLAPRKILPEITGSQFCLLCHFGGASLYYGKAWAGSASGMGFAWNFCF